MENLLGTTFWAALLISSATATVYLMVIWLKHLYRDTKEWIQESIYWYHRNKEIKADQLNREKLDQETRSLVKKIINS